MRKSKAEVFRHGLQKEDILREPISIFFSSMVAFGPKDDSKTQKDCEPSAI